MGEPTSGQLPGGGGGGLDPLCELHVMCRSVHQRQQAL